MATMKAIRMDTYGGPEVLIYEDAPIPEEGNGFELSLFSSGVPCPRGVETFTKVVKAKNGDSILF